jgi:hypothetical protein
MSMDGGNLRQQAEAARDAALVKLREAEGRREAVHRMFQEERDRRMEADVMLRVEKKRQNAISKLLRKEEVRKQVGRTKQLKKEKGRVEAAIKTLQMEKVRRDISCKILEELCSFPSDEWSAASAAFEAMLQLKDLLTVEDVKALVCDRACNSSNYDRLPTELLRQEAAVAIALQENEKKIRPNVTDDELDHIIFDSYADHLLCYTPDEEVYGEKVNFKSLVYREMEAEDPRLCAAAGDDGGGSGGGGSGHKRARAASDGGVAAGGGSA